MATRVGVAPRFVSTYGASAKPAAGNSWETASWYFFRVSGIVLIFLVIFHLVLMHVTTDVSQTNYGFVAARYQNPFWRVYDLSLLTLALPHGLNGLRVICDDYIRTRGTRLLAQSLLFLIVLVFWLMGTLTIIMFHPGQNVIQTVMSMVQH